MYYVYHLQSENNPDRYYVGLTSDVERRLEEHNAGKSIHTNKFRPWKLVTYTAFVYIENIPEILTEEVIEASLAAARAEIFAAAATRPGHARPR